MKNCHFLRGALNLTRGALSQRGWEPLSSTATSALSPLRYILSKLSLTPKSLQYERYDGQTEYNRKRGEKNTWWKCNIFPIFYLCNKFLLLPAFPVLYYSLSFFNESVVRLLFYLMHISTIFIPVSHTPLMSRYVVCFLVASQSQYLEAVSPWSVLAACTVLTFFFIVLLYRLASEGLFDLIVWPTFHFR